MIVGCPSVSRDVVAAEVAEVDLSLANENELASLFC